MPTYKEFPPKIFVIKDKISGLYRTGTHTNTLPKLYKHSPGLQQNEELLEISIVIWHQ